jgi:hypothetical protein
MVETEKHMMSRGGWEEWEDVPHLLPQWTHAQRQLADQLIRYGEGIPEHLDCNPKNFIFAPECGVLFYVDSEPTFIRTARTNAVNMRFLNWLIYPPKK